MDFWSTFARDFMANEPDYVDPWFFCVEVCKALYDGLKGRRLPPSICITD